ncbi:MAG: RND transporter, partial [Oscillospiraceae bacterium]|nr:RND transporter [Oscillospiraceae bacterium]
MNETPKNREWVKNAAIVFLAVLLVLTFFSNTIMNRSLPEVATQDVTDGAIVSKVRGSGTVTANGNNQVKMEKTRVIRAVLVKSGQEV